MNKIMDIVSNKIDVTKDTITLYDLLLKQLDKEETAYIISKANFEESQEELKFLIKTKKYLEVLEILRRSVFAKNYIIDTEYEYITLKDNYGDSIDLDLDEEDFNKLKQWLEENENDR